MCKKFLLFSLIICSFRIVDAQSNSKQYTMFRGNVQHSGVYTATNVSNRPAILWTFKTGGFVNSSAAMEGNNLFFGSGDGYLYCVDSRNGSLVWKFKTGGPVHSSPAVINGEVFFGSHDGNFYALNAKDGKQKWVFKTEGEKRYSARGINGWLPKDSVFADIWDFWLSSPAIEDNVIYFGSGDGYFYAINKNNGKEKWKFKTNGVIHTSPALAFGNVYFGGWDTYLHALNAETGKEVWKFKTGEDTVIYNQTGITSSPLISGNLLYFGSRDSHLYALDPVTGNLVWKQYNDRGWVSVTPVVYDDKLIYTSGSSTSFVAVDKLTGGPIYKETATSPFSSPTIVGTTVYIGSLNGLMEGREVNTGKIIWSYRLPSSLENKYHLLNDDLSYNPQAMNEALEKFNGTKKPVEIRLTLGSILSSPIIKDGVIYFGSTDGNFYALK